MPIYKIRGIDVDFPYEAYDCQIVYMEKVIQSLQDKCNALLESPTGTGKTLCLLCATLAWRKSLGDFSTGPRSQPWGFRQTEEAQALSQSRQPKLPTIVYTSRTHSQLHQVIQELKRTNYRPKMTVLGSREQLCIHDEVRVLQGKAQINACHFACKRHKCSRQRAVSGYAKNNPNLGDDPVDIEDLVNIGRNEGPCPYYVSRELHKVVDILFAPYNYLIDRRNQKSLSIEFQNCVLIFDEAHNLESLCADAASFDLPSGLLTACISEAKKCVDLAIAKRSIQKSNEKSLDPDTFAFSREKSNEKPLDPDSFAILKALLLKLEKRIAEVPIASKELGFTRPGPYIYELLVDLNITQETASMLIETVESAALLLEEAENSTESGAQQGKGTICRLESIGDILGIIFKGGDKAHAQSYRVHVQESEVNAFGAVKGKKTTRTLSWWCFNPGIAMEELSKRGVGSIILTSGTLSPLDSFAQELKLEFPVQLENPHVISSNQIWAGVVPAGPSACSFNSSYRNRDSLEYKQELGNAIANFARIVPSGLLVFFPSYYLLDQCIGCWKDMGHTSSTASSTIWERICKYKQPVVEPRQSSLFPSSIQDFMTKLNDTSTSGAVFFAVCRGKVSEGLDFADHAGRAVVVIGMPFAMRNDPKIRLKREYLDLQAQSQIKEQKVLTGEEWYSQLESRAVNQAVGRVIRHRNDYGAIIFCDERFAHSNRQTQMSVWLRPYIKCYSRFGEVVFTLTRFFRDIGISSSTKPRLAESIIGLPSSEAIVHEGLLEPTLTDNANGMLLSQSPLPDIFLLSKTRNHLANSTESCCEKPLSSVLATSRRNTSNLLEEILPANCSTLNSHKPQLSLSLNHSKDQFLKERNLRSSDSQRKDPSSQNCEVIDLTSDFHRDGQPSTRELIDLTSNCHWDGQPSRAKLIVPCSSKKPKLLSKDPEISCYSSFSEISEKHGKRPQLSSYRPMEPGIGDGTKNIQHSKGAAEILLVDDMTTKKTEFKHKGVTSNPIPCHDETKGSAFLIQVQEKLTIAEYKEFVGYMKALKSKTMKISYVLQSIAKLFSTPERLLLLIRFKDFVPAKHRPMYEQLLGTHGAIFDE